MKTLLLTLLVTFRLVAESCTNNTIILSSSSLGSDLGAKINNATSNIYGCGGVIDARAFTGAQSAAAPIYLGINAAGSVTYPVALLLGAVQFKVHGITLGYESSIQGVPTGLTAGNPQQAKPGNSNDDYWDRFGYTQLIAADGVPLTSVVAVGSNSTAHAGDQVSLRDILVDGNRGTGSTIKAGILVYSALRVDMSNVAVLGSSGDGIQFAGTPVSCTSFNTGNTTNVPKLSKIMAIANYGNGLNFQYTNDVFLSEVEANNNSLVGILLNQSSGARITHSDISTNQNGVHLVNSYLLNLTTTQFNANSQVDVRSEVSSGCPSSSQNIVSSNNFTGNGSRLSGNYPMVYFQNAFNTVVMGNNFIITQNGGMTNWTGIQFDQGGNSHSTLGNTFGGAVPVTRCYIDDNGNCTMNAGAMKKK